MSPSATTATTSVPDTLQQLAAYLQTSLTATQEEIIGYAQTLHTLDQQLIEEAMAVPLLKTLIEEIRHLTNPQIVGWDICFPDYVSRKSTATALCNWLRWKVKTGPLTRSMKRRCSSYYQVRFHQTRSRSFVT